MAAIKSKILYDKTEIVVIDLGEKRPFSKSRPKVLNLPYNKVISIQFDSSSVKKLFKTVPSEKLSITIQGKETPLVLFEANEKAYWADYIRDLTRFAKDNRVSFRDNRQAK